MDGFKDDVHDKTEAAEWAGGLTDAAFETGSGIAKRGFHLLDVYGVPLRDPGEISDVAVAFDQQADQPAFRGRVERFIEREIAVGPGVNNAVDEEGKAGEFHTRGGYMVTGLHCYIEVFQCFGR